MAVRKIWMSGLFLCVLALILVAAAIPKLRFRGSVTVHAGEEIEPGAEIAFFRQDDERWAQERLGDSDFTMKSSGCLVCCITSALVMGGKIQETPYEVNRRFSQQGVYDTQGNIVWDHLRRSEGCEVEVFGAGDGKLLSECLRDGKYPIVRVRVNATGSFHYVLITGARGGVFYCMDPMKDGERSLAEYGNRIYAVRLVG